MTKFQMVGVMERRLSRWKIIIALVAILPTSAIHCAFAKDEFHEVPEDLFGPSCREYLLPEPKQRFSEKVHFVSRYQKFRIGRRPDYRGFYIEPREPKTPSEVRSVSIDLEQPLIKSESWDFANQQQMFFVSAGFHNLEPESYKLNTLVADHIMNHLGEGLIIDYRRKRAREEKRLYNFRWNVHDAVMSVYADYKQYLEPDDFSKLIEYNQHSSHNDVFGLMYTPPSLLAEMRFEDVFPELLMTIQISYYGSRNYLEPSLKGVMAARGFGYYEQEDRLPFEYLISPEKLPEFRKKFYSAFDAQTTCEMNRYAKLHALATLPSEYHSLFLLKAITTAKAEGMKTIVAVGDKATMVIFRRYGFKLWGALPVKGEPEYLMYMEIDSSEYLAFFNRLSLRSEDVKVKQLQ